MPITNAPGPTTFSNPTLGLPAANQQMPGMQGAGQNIGIPGQGMTMPQFNFQAPPKDLPISFQSIQGLLQTPQQSMTNSVMPGIAQMLGLQTQSALPAFQRQTGQMQAGVQSQMQQRGLTGSSIEAAGLLGAQQAGMANMNQFFAEQAGKLAQDYMQSVGMDIQANQEMYQNLAQAIGQQLQSQIQQQQFQQQLGAGLDQARLLAGAQKNAGMWQGIGSMVGPLLGVAGKKLMGG